jgi:hypothetical protein
MRKLLPLIVALFTLAGATYHNSACGQNDTAAWKIKLSEYNLKLREADAYEIKSEAQLQKADEFRIVAQKFLDSATIEGRKVKLDYENASAHLVLFNKIYNISLIYTDKADSTLKIAQAYKDTANALNAKAETFYLKIADEYKTLMQAKVITVDTTNDNTATKVSVDTVQDYVIFVVQLGAGNMKSKYFSKVNDVEVITPSDHIKRYVVGKFKTKEDAIAYKKKMIELGYKDAFVRTLDSLDY